MWDSVMNRNPIASVHTHPLLGASPSGERAGRLNENVQQGAFREP